MKKYILLFIVLMAGAFFVLFGCDNNKEVSMFKEDGMTYTAEWYKKTYIDPVIKRIDKHQKEKARQEADERKLALQEAKKAVDTIE